MKTVNLEKRGDYYDAWHQDARDIQAALGDIVLLKCGGADMIGIPAHGLEQHIADLNGKRISVKINPKIEWT